MPTIKALTYKHRAARWRDETKLRLPVCELLVCLALAIAVPASTAEPPQTPCNCNKALEAKIVEQLKSTDKKFGKSSVQYLRASLALADLQTRKREFRASETQVQKVLSEAQRLKNDPLRAEALLIASRNALAAGRKTDAASAAAQACQITKKTGDTRAESRALWQLGRVQAQSQQLSEARLSFESALAKKRLRTGKDDEETAFQLQELASVYQQIGDYKKASALLERALADITRIRGQKHSSAGWLRMLLAESYLKSGEPERSAKLLQICIADYESIYGRQSAQLIGLLSQQAIVLETLGKKNEAESARKRIRDIGATIRFDTSPAARND